MEMRQPFTATQWSVQSGIVVQDCMAIFAKARQHGLLRCLNPQAQRSRLFWLTCSGLKHQKHLRAARGLPPSERDLPEIDWQLYAGMCFAHRSAVIKAMDEPMQPSQIRRRAVSSNARLRMSANNVRDVIRFLRNKGIVQPIKVRKKAHFRYELTEQGQHFKRLLLQVGVGP